jgi:hypothetical protein
MVPAPEGFDLGAMRDMAIVNRLTVRHALGRLCRDGTALRGCTRLGKFQTSISVRVTAYDRGDHAITIAASAVVPLLHDEERGHRSSSQDAQYGGGAIPGRRNRLP